MLAVSVSILFIREILSDRAGSNSLRTMPKRKWLLPSGWESTLYRLWELVGEQ